MVALHRRKSYSFLCFFILIFLLFSSASFATRLEEKKEELREIQIRLRQANQKIKEAEGEEKSLGVEIERIDRNLSSLQSEIDQLELELAEVANFRKELEKSLEILGQKILAKEAEIEEIGQKLSFQTDTLGKRLSEFYRKGDVGYLEVLLNSENFRDFLTRLSFLNFIIDGDYKLLKKIKETKNILELKRKELEEERKEVLEKKAQIMLQERKYQSLILVRRSKEKEVEAQLEEKHNYLERVRQNKAYYLKLEEELEKSSNELIYIIKALERKSSSIFSGSFLWPVNGEITSGYGMRWHPILGGYRKHNGIDIGADFGESVRASQSGTVILAQWFDGYGKTVILDHGGGVSTLYAHLSSILVSEGDFVSVGEDIAKVGSTGYSTGPHLHFEIRVQGVPQNPLKYF